MYKTGLVFLPLVVLTGLISAAPEVCRYEGQTHRVGEDFITRDCSGRCRCTIPAGGVECVDLCPPVYPRCGPGEKMSKKMVPVYDGQCKCPRYICVKARRQLIDDMFGDYYQDHY